MQAILDSILDYTFSYINIIALCVIKVTGLYMDFLVSLGFEIVLSGIFQN